MCLRKLLFLFTMSCIAGAGLALDFSPGAEEKKTNGYADRKRVFDRLGIKECYYLATPPPTPVSLSAPHASSPLAKNTLHQRWLFLPGSYPEDVVLPTGWLLHLKKGALAQAGFRTGDVMTRIGDLEYLRSTNEVDESISLAFNKKGSCLLTIRHFKDGFWRKDEEPTRSEKDKRSSECFADREILLVPWK